jgi:nucleotide-binding universal stress UspA family protein
VEVAMTGRTGGILAGYDGSSGSEHALSWAAREARSRGIALTVRHTWAVFLSCRRTSSRRSPGTRRSIRR